jgi:2-haloalkanoic acid dehalogenase type II
MDWETITFDCYGTLVDWETGIFEAFRDAAAIDAIILGRAEVLAAYHDIEAEVEEEEYRPYREVLGEVALRVAERLGWKLAPERAGFLAASLPDWPVFDDTRAALERLKRRFRIAILSNVDDDLLQATIERIAVDFDWTVTAQQTRSYKPAPTHFLEAIDRVGGDRQCLLHAACSYYHDIRPAKELGLKTVWVNRAVEPLDGRPRPGHEVRDLLELADWLGVE